MPTQKIIASFFSLIFLFQPLHVFAQPQAVSFFIDSNHDASGRSSAKVLLLKTGTSAYFYIDKDYYENLSTADRVALESAVENLNQEFTTTIYPKTRALLGEEWNPGIDGDSRIFIFMHPMKEESGGYVRPQDEYPVAAFANSNEHELIYLNTSKLTHPHIKSILAHEFQHLINLYQKERLRGVREETWLNEALSEYVPTFLGYNNVWEGSYLKTRVQDFLNLPPDSLLDWSGSAADLASVNIFIHYLTDRYGTDLLRNLEGTSMTGKAALDEVLAGSGLRLRDVFTNWAIANFINNITEGHGDLYTYRNPNLFFGHLRANVSATFNMFSGTKAEGTFAVKDWQAAYFKFQPAVLGNTGENVLRITFDGEDRNTEFRVAYLASDFSGRYNVQFLDVVNSERKGIVYVPDFGTKVSSVAVVVASVFADSMETGTHFFKPFLLSGELGGDSLASYPDGSLLRRAGDTKVYVVKGGALRWIQSPEIFNGYGHLRWENILGVNQEVLGLYRESRLIRKYDDFRVFEVDAGGTKHWLNMDPRAFETSGRSWEDIYIVNENEFNWFKLGLDMRS